MQHWTGSNLENSGDPIMGCSMWCRGFNLKGKRKRAGPLTCVVSGILQFLQWRSRPYQMKNLDRHRQMDVEKKWEAGHRCSEVALDLVYQQFELATCPHETRDCVQPLVGSMGGKHISPLVYGWLSPPEQWPHKKKINNILLNVRVKRGNYAFHPWFLKDLKTQVAPEKFPDPVP